VVCYCDSTIALPLMTHYVLARGLRREPKRLYDRRDELIVSLERAFRQKRARADEAVFDPESY
jgi:deoxyhypusine synthase